MKTRLEASVCVAALVVLAALVLVEGRRRSDLERAVPVTAAELYHTLARAQAKPQIVDVRRDLAEGYEDSHLPGAIPMPGCDLAKAPETARPKIIASVPTVIVGDDKAPGDAQACLSRFTSARVLAGGMAAWDDASLPADSGEYAPPSAKAGGGCL